MKLLVSSVGAIIAFSTILWWHFEVVGRLGATPFSETVKCLAKIGTGECGGLWLAGLHQENQIAAAIFYIGIATALVGLLLPAGRRAGS
jgi:hypothetical protein